MKNRKRRNNNGNNDWGKGYRQSQSYISDRILHLREENMKQTRFLC